MPDSITFIKIWKLEIQLSVEWGNLDHQLYFKSQTLYS